MASTQTGDSAADQAKEKAQQAGEQVKQQAQQAGEQAKSRVRDEVDRRSTDAGEQATSVADAIRQASQHLREQGKDQAAKPMDQAAQRVESAGQWLRDSDGDRILRDVEDFGRRNPLAVAAGGLAIGFALSRLLKASSSNRYHGTSAPQPGGTNTGLGNGRGSLPQSTPAAPQPTTSAPRPGGVPVPDLPAPERSTGPGAAPGVTGGPVPPAPPSTGGGTGTF
jgi:hypothetical protein